MAATTNSKMNTHLPPKRSVRIPKGSRKMEPVSTGMFINHPAKHRVNAIVFKVNMRCDLPVAFSIMFIVLRS